MLRLSPAIAALSLGLLSGCTAGTPAITAAGAAPQPRASQQTTHNFQMFGMSDREQFLVDTPTGQVWQLQKSGTQEKFIPVQVARIDHPEAPFWVADPNGKIHGFDTQAQADEFKRLAGISR